MGFVCDVLSHSAKLRIIWEFEGWKYLFYQLKYLMLRKNSFTRYDLPTRRLPYTATNSDYLIEIFGRGVPSPLFFRLSFLLPFNSIYTVANRKKLPENSAKTVKQSPFSLSLIHLVLILWHFSSISDTGNAEKRSFALSATQ